MLEWASQVVSDYGRVGYLSDFHGEFISILILL